MNIEVTARELGLHYLESSPNECRMPPHLSVFVGGPRDGDWQPEARQKPAIYVPRRSDVIHDDGDPSVLPSLTETGEYRPKTWADLHHNLPSCQSSHRVTEYRWRE